MSVFPLQSPFPVSHIITRNPSLRQIVNNMIDRKDEGKTLYRHVRSCGKMSRRLPKCRVEGRKNGACEGDTRGERNTYPWPRGPWKSFPGHYPITSLRSRRLEVVGERENGRARERHARGEGALARKAPENRFQLAFCECGYFQLVERLPREKLTARGEKTVNQ